MAIGEQLAQLKGLLGGTALVLAAVADGSTVACQLDAQQARGIGGCLTAYHLLQRVGQLAVVTLAETHVIGQQEMASHHRGANRRHSGGKELHPGVADAHDAGARCLGNVGRHVGNGGTAAAHRQTAQQQVLVGMRMAALPRALLTLDIQGRARHPRLVRYGGVIDERASTRAGIACDNGDVDAPALLQTVGTLLVALAAVAVDGDRRHAGIVARGLQHRGEKQRLAGIEG